MENWVQESFHVAFEIPLSQSFCNNRQLNAMNVNSVYSTITFRALCVNNLKRYRVSQIWGSNVVGIDFCNKLPCVFLKGGVVLVVFYNKLMWFVSELPEKDLSNLVQCR